MVDSPGDQTGRPRIIPFVFLSGLVVGVLDGLDALIFFSARGIQPARIFQYIAIAILGPGTARGGGKTLAIGIFLHFCVATTISLVFMLVTYFIPRLAKHPFIVGPLFGIVAYYVMGFVVVPFFIVSARGGGLAPWPVEVNGLVGHAFLIGLPIALITRWSMRKS